MSIPQVLRLFQELLPAPVIRALMQTAGVRFYERLFTPLLVVWCFLYQRLSADHTLDAVVSHVASGAFDPLAARAHPALSARLRSANTAGYSRARSRMPLSVLQGVARHLAQAAPLPPAGRWQGHPVALLDGTTLVLRPYGDIAAHYGRVRNQHGVAYWVVMRVVAAFCLHSGVLLAAQDGPLRESEQALAPAVLGQLAPGTLCLGDRNFGVFSVAQAARHHQVEVLLRLTACRAQALAGRPLRPNEELRLAWAPSRHDRRDREMSVCPIRGRLLAVRLERAGFRAVELYFFTTLRSSRCYPLAELVALYGERWHVELDLRVVKRRLDMECLSAKSAAMAQKELWAGLAGYNIVRVCMLRAAQAAGLAPRTLSFSQCWRRVQGHALGEPCPMAPVEEAQGGSRFLAELARCRLQKRTRFRVEPRAVRLRAVQYVALKGSRDEARQRVRQQQLTEPAKC